MCASCSHVEKAFHKYKDFEKGVFPKIPTYYIKEKYMLSLIAIGHRDFVLQPLFLRQYISLQFLVIYQGARLT